MANILSSIELNKEIDIKIPFFWFFKYFLQAANKIFLFALLELSIMEIPLLEVIKDPDFFLFLSPLFIYKNVKLSLPNGKTWLEVSAIKSFVLFKNKQLKLCPLIIGILCCWLILSNISLYIWIEVSWHIIEYSAIDLIYFFNINFTKYQIKIKIIKY